MPDAPAAVRPLRRRMINDMTRRNLSPATQRSALHAVTTFSRYSGRSPDRLGLHGNESRLTAGCIEDGGEEVGVPSGGFAGGFDGSFAASGPDEVEGEASGMSRLMLRKRERRCPL
jgi:hypothetical protein